MDAKHVVLVALAGSLLLVGAAGAATAQPANDSAPEAPGPPDDAPGGPPDVVSDVHDTISDFLSGSVDHLGSAISDLRPGDDGAHGDEGDQSVDERPDAADDPADRYPVFEAAPRPPDAEP